MIQEIDPNDDGVTHINMYTGARTQLGRMMTNLADIPIDHPEYGRFACLEGFYHWLATGMQYNGYRFLNGFAAKRFANQHVKVNVHNFQSEIAYAFKLKVDQTPELKQAIVDSNLPFMHYYVHRSAMHAPKVVLQPHHEWQCEVWEDIRTDLKLGQFEVGR